MRAAVAAARGGRSRLVEHARRRRDRAHPWRASPGGHHRGRRPRRQQRGRSARRSPTAACPINVVADDSVVPRAVRAPARASARAGASTLIPWRNLREIFGVLRRREMLGLLVDWGYRSDGIPVRLFDAWTTLPAGPATLAAKTGVARSCRSSIRRRPDGRFGVVSGEPIDGRRRPTRPTSSGRPRRSPTPSPRPIAAGPEQWYSFKPIWPATTPRRRRPRARARRRCRPAGRDPGPGRRPAAATRPTRSGAPTRARRAPRHDGPRPR